MLKFTTENRRLYLNGKLIASCLTPYKAELLAHTLNVALERHRDRSPYERARNLVQCAHRFDPDRRNLLNAACPA